MNTPGQHLDTINSTERPSQGGDASAMRIALALSAALTIAGCGGEAVQSDPDASYLADPVTELSHSDVIEAESTLDEVEVVNVIPVDGGVNVFVGFPDGYEGEAVPVSIVVHDSNGEFLESVIHYVSPQDRVVRHNYKKPDHSSSLEIAVNGGPVYFLDLDKSTLKP